MHPRGLDTSESPPAAAEVCALLGGVISGMDYIHNVQGLLHGDLKPLNMLIKGQKVKLCDFGSSQLLRHAPADLASTGTLPYLAPEILRSAVDEPSDRPRAGDPAPRAGDPATDVYSFGVSVWEMCTRLYPWHSLLRRGSVDEASVSQQVSQDDPDPPAHVSHLACLTCHTHQRCSHVSPPLWTPPAPPLPPPNSTSS